MMKHKSATQQLPHEDKSSSTAAARSFPKSILHRLLGNLHYHHHHHGSSNGNSSTKQRASVETTTTTTETMTTTTEFEVSANIELQDLQSQFAQCTITASSTAQVHRMTTAGLFNEHHKQHNSIAGHCDQQQQFKNNNNQQQQQQPLPHNFFHQHQHSNSTDHTFKQHSQQPQQQPPQRPTSQPTSGITKKSSRQAQAQQVPSISTCIEKEIRRHFASVCTSTTPVHKDKKMNPDAAEEEEDETMEERHHHSCPATSSNMYSTSTSPASHIRPSTTKTIDEQQIELYQALYSYKLGSHNDSYTHYTPHRLRKDITFYKDNFKPNSSRSVGLTLHAKLELTVKNGVKASAC